MNDKYESFDEIMMLIAKHGKSEEILDLIIKEKEGIKAILTQYKEYIDAGLFEQLAQSNFQLVIDTNNSQYDLEEPYNYCVIPSKMVNNDQVFILDSCKTKEEAVEFCMKLGLPFKDIT